MFPTTVEEAARVIEPVVDVELKVDIGDDLTVELDIPEMVDVREEVTCRLELVLLAFAKYAAFKLRASAIEVLA